MKLFTWNLLPHRFDHAMHWPWQEPQGDEPPPTGSLVLSVALLSLAAAAVLVLTV